ncbi:hypothetical protein [Streptacidiphilus sp. PAMC 29251]
MHHDPHAAQDAANHAIRQLAASVTVWTPEDLAELDRLRRVWAAAREIAGASEGELLGV